MTLRGRQICSSGSSHVLFINPLKRHLTLLHQSRGAPESTSIPFAPRWLAQVFLCTTAASFCSWWAREGKESTNIGFPSAASLRKKNHFSASYRWNPSRRGVRTQKGKFVQCQVLLDLHSANYYRRDASSIFVGRGSLRPRGAWQLQRAFPWTDWYLLWRSHSGIMEMNDSTSRASLGLCMQH